MARPIKETPILFGKDAERFLKEMKEVKKASPEDFTIGHKKPGFITSN